MFSQPRLWGSCSAGAPGSPPSCDFFAADYQRRRLKALAGHWTGTRLYLFPVHVMAATQSYGEESRPPVEETAPVPPYRW